MPTIAIILEKIIRGGGEMLYADVFEEMDEEFEVEFWNIGPTNEEVASTLESVSGAVIQLGDYTTHEKYVLRPVPRIVRTIRNRDIDIIHGSSLYSNLLAKLAGNFTQTAIVGQIHGYPENRMRPVLLADLLTNRLANRTVTNSQAVANRAYGEPDSVRRRLSGGNVTVIPCGINIEFVETFKDAPPSAPGGVGDFRDGISTIVNVGRLIEAKNQIVLLQAFSKIKVPNTHLIIIGGGPKEDQLKSYAKQNNIMKRTHFLGNIPRQDVLKIVSNADLFVSPSVREGFGISVIEALALKVPTILSDIPAYRELFDHPIVPDEINIHLDPHETNIWAKRIKQILDNDQTREEIAQLGRQIVLENYTITEVTRHYERIYREALD